VRAAGERLDVQRLRVLPVDPVPDTAQPREVAQVLFRGESAGHLVILSIRLPAQHDGGCLFGNDDRYPTPEPVDQHEAELKRLGAAMDGWEKVFAFFGTHLS
jgi:hypothetical protein